MSCYDDSQCTNGICNLDTNICDCNEGYVASGPICVGWSNFLLFLFFGWDNLTFWIFHYFTLECIYDGQCTQLNKGICNIETKRCICNIGYFEDGSSCGGGFGFVNFHFWLTETIFTLIQFPHRMPRGSSLQWS